MKKIVSFVLAALLLVSAVPMAHATNDYTAGTAVVYTAANTEAYTVTVPAQLAPGGSGTVTLEGTWASDRVVSVTADKNVVLTNSINAADQKTLNVSFPGIDEYGSNTTSQTFTETVSVANITDALFGTWSGRFYYNVDVYDVVDYLQVKYPFDYYSTMNLAVTDVNNGTIGASADIAKENKENAVAGIYTDENDGINIVLLKDATEATSIKPSSDMTINLGGHTLSSSAQVAINILDGNLTIDGRLDGSTIKAEHETTAIAVQCQNDSTTTVTGGTYISTTNSGSANTYGITVYHTATLNISNANINILGHGGGNSLGIGALGTSSVTISDATICSTTVGGLAYGVQPIPGTTASLSNCTITASNTTGNAYAVYNGGNTTISDSDIRAYSNYDVDENDSYLSSSLGIYNHKQGTLTLNDCYVMGTHSGVSNYGTLYVNGGTYEGYGHGGFYFCGAGTTSYVQNATIRECAMPNGYSATNNTNLAGFYIGGNNDMKIYMDNCDIYGSGQPIVLRGTDGEQNNSLYISNSRINKNYTMMGVRIDNDTHRLYIGQNCNFDISDCAPLSSLPQFDMSVAVFETDEIYIMN